MAGGVSIRTIHDYVGAVSLAIDNSEGPFLSSLFSVYNAGHTAVVALGLDVIRDESRLVQRVPEKLGEMLLMLMQAMRSLHSRRYAEAFSNHLQAANLFLPVFRNWEGPWALPVLHVLVHDLRCLGKQADDELRSIGKTPDRLKGAASFMMKVFGAIAGKGPKKAGSLFVACQLFKIYFQLGTLNLSKSIIRVVEASRGFQDFPMRDQVTYRYYTGRLDVFNDAFTEADAKLSFALQHCHRNKPGNIRHILRYLIPVRLSLGLLPTQKLLARYSLNEYDGIVQALRNGDMRLLRDSLQHHEDKFLRSGVYLALEKLELHVYRRLIRKIHVIQRSRDPPRAHQLKMDLFLLALKWRQSPMDSDEMECILATLISRGFIKGYFSHKSKVLVLSKQEPFPRLVGKVLI